MSWSMKLEVDQKVIKQRWRSDSRISYSQHAYASTPTEMSNDLTCVYYTVTLLHIIKLSLFATSYPYILDHLTSNANHSVVRCGTLGYRLLLQLHTLCFLDVWPRRQTQSHRCLVSNGSLHNSSYTMYCDLPVTLSIVEQRNTYDSDR